jgi:hypothetical protein
MKIKLVLQPDQFSSFTSWYLESLWLEYFDIEIYRSDQHYSPGTLFVFWHGNANDPIVEQLFAQGHKIVLDNLWEKYRTEYNKFYQLNNPNWFWWNESLWWTALGYDQYRPNKTYQKIALMPIRVVKPARDIIVQRTRPFHDQMIWSYREQQLPNDAYLENSSDVDQRYMNPQWYDDCCISLVVETAQHSTGLIVSEKTYKPCAYYQPMIVMGVPGALKFIQQQGFETFDNLFDESYDQPAPFDQRLDIVLDNLRRVKPEPYSELTWKKLRHNRNHFFNTQLCRQGIIEEIIKPLLEYSECH